MSVHDASNCAGAIAGNDLAVALSELARSLRDERDEQGALDAIVAAAVDTVPGAEYAGLTVRHRRRIDTRAATDEVVRQVDQAQYDTGQGPCLDATREQQTVLLPDTADEQRWPVFAHRAAGLGIRSMLCFPLYVERDNVGALNLYSRDRGAFDDDSENVGLLFAAHATIAMSGVLQQEQCGRVIQVRDLIGQAKGILMERYRLTADQAFGLLVRVSQRTGTKLIDVARHLAETGALSPSGER